MQFTWINYDTARLSHYPDGGVDPVVDATAAVEMLDPAVHARVGPLVVKLYGLDQDGNPAGQFSGFIFGDIIVAAGHMEGYSGKPPGSTQPAVAFKVRYPTDGFEEDVEVVAHPPPNTCPDLMLLKGSRSAKRLAALSPSQMDPAYAFGYTGTELEPICSKCVLANLKPGAEAIVTARADEGFAGGPVVNKYGHLLGVVKSPLGTAAMRIGLTTTHSLHTYLAQSGYPGLS